MHFEDSGAVINDCCEGNVRVLYLVPVLLMHWWQTTEGDTQDLLLLGGQLHVGRLS